MRDVCARLEGPRADTARRVVVKGSQGSTAPLFASAISYKLSRPVLLVVAHLDDADDALDDLELVAQWMNARTVSWGTRRFGAMEVLPGESTINVELLAERLAVVEMLSASKAKPAMNWGRGAGVLVAPVQALMQGVPEPERISKLSMTLESGMEMPIAALMGWLSNAGYERVDAVESPGQFVVRGGIVEIFPPGDSRQNDAGDDMMLGGAVRLDFFGDVIESICRIDSETMRSGPRVDRVQVIGADASKLQSDEGTTTLLSLLPADTVVLMHEVLELSEQARGYYERITNPRGIYSPASVFQALTGFDHIELNQYSGTVLAAPPAPKVTPSGRLARKRTNEPELKKPAAGDGPIIELPVGVLPAFAREAANAIVELGELADAATPEKAKASGADVGDVVVLCAKDGERDRLMELLTEHLPDGAIPPRLRIEMGYLHRGFVWRDTQSSDPIYLVPHHELFHRFDLRRRVRRISSGAGGVAAGGAKASDAFLDLSPGDYVVHVDHGIARFAALRTMKKEGRSEEFLTLEFAGGATLHVPATQIDLVQKYVGGFHGKPPLSTIGGRRWAKQKEDVANAVKDMAAELLRVQAARASMPGIRYPADTTWQKEFEAEFPYDETQDQLAAIGEMKRDMSSPRPMDRLICGDVGFGKTEIAIRAAFKAAEYGKQVAVLVPTTLLAEQHERTFRSRMADYPFTVESISRFKTGAEARETLAKLGEGKIDIIIGTHRLLSQDVKFADLGLVIIDEEQRFGVEHKHKLLSLRLMVDVMTLSATPIPRTLHMSMLGLRDISSLTTAPVERRAVVTEVTHFDPSRIQRAIIRELNRDGQVYFVHNRVHDIQSMADDIKRLVPDARIVVGHGQMAAGELEEVMVKFVRREADILVSTTIIESGIDIATANTMFINNADHFGLAELHQLRGRVGRYKNRAYCYLLLPADRPITDAGTQRLKAIEQYSMLGAGFKIAMRDLEIRGAGNLLGAEQSGHIAAVGYEMYCQLLEDASRKLKQEAKIEPSKTHIELPVMSTIPKGYIASEKFRMDAYRRISRATTLEQFDTVTKGLEEAYGPPPAQVRTLLEMTEIRIAAGTLGVESIKLERPDVIIRTSSPLKLDAVFKGAPGRTTMVDDRTVYFRPPENYLEPSTLLAVLRKLFVRPLRESATAAK